MRRFARPLLPLASCIAALMLGACAGTNGSIDPVVPGAAANSSVFAPANAPIKPKASPKKLNFTTKPVIKMTVTESKYKGKFKLKVSPSGIVKLSTKSGKGPKAKITITALHAGKASITITDANGGKTIVPVAVTQGVIIIQ
jgi:hypothetical protein